MSIHHQTTSPHMTWSPHHHAATLLEQETVRITVVLASEHTQQQTKEHNDHDSSDHGEDTLLLYVFLFKCSFIEKDETNTDEGVQEENDVCLSNELAVTTTVDVCDLAWKYSAGE